MDLLIIGSGLSGAVLANKFAKLNKKVLILEKRPQIAGNIFDKKINGITTHMYGPHIFHTNDKDVVEYMNQFWELNEFKNEVEGKILDKIIPIPFNFLGIDKFWPSESNEMKKKLINIFGNNSKIKIFDLLSNNDEQIKKIGNFIYKNVIENYT
ncbi:MAG: NAD(P)-binding protein, partial [Mycoplasmatales bacterium]|nr:NAD(P)-binding protein [Mycoplasmatales bacterium]